MQSHAPRALDEIESAEYCCDRPRLSWNGDPDAPSIACENCGYIVAEFGQVRANAPATEKPAAEPQQRQGNLFE